MKSLLILIASILLGGCQTRLPSRKLPVPASEPLPIAASLPKSVAPAPDLELKMRQQAQLIDALMSQNDALTARAHEFESRVPASVLPAAETPVPAPIVSPPAPSAAPPSPADPITPALRWIAPNAAGVIDLTAVETATEPEGANPFALRTSTSPATESKMIVQGIVCAGQRRCAVVNDRLIEIGDVVDPCRLTRIEPDALIFMVGERALRLPFAETRVRHG